MSYFNILISRGKEIKIEPYWNVNAFEPFIPALACNIKIEPYWNVNTELNKGDKDDDGLKIRLFPRAKERDDRGI